jgi:hypothetical protein
MCNNNALNFIPWMFYLKAVVDRFRVGKEAFCSPDFFRNLCKLRTKTRKRVFTQEVNLQSNERAKKRFHTRCRAAETRPSVREKTRFFGEINLHKSTKSARRVITHLCIKKIKKASRANSYSLFFH